MGSESIVLYPEQILHDLKKEEKKSKNDGILHSNDNKIIDQQFYQLYNPNSFLSFDVQMLISSAVSFSTTPRLLLFGTGYDSQLFCKAATDMHPNSEIYFLENDEEWLNFANSTLSRISDRCKVFKVNYETKLESWMDLLGLEDDIEVC